MTWQIYDLVGLFWIRFSSSWIYVAFNTQTIVVPKINERIGDFFFNFFGDKRNKLSPPPSFFLCCLQIQYLSFCNDSEQNSKMFMHLYLQEMRFFAKLSVLH